MGFSQGDLDLIVTRELEEVMDLLLQKGEGIITRAELGDILDHGVRDRAFWVSRLSEIEMVEEVYMGLMQNAAAGGTIMEFLDSMDLLFSANGWDELAPWHLETIYINNLQSAYNAVHYERQIESTDILPWWLLDVTMDTRTSEICEPLGNPPIIYPAGHPIWAYLYPPLHHRCRTLVLALGRESMVRYGWSQTEQMPTVRDRDGSEKPWAPQEGWGGPPQLNNQQDFTGRIAEIREGMGL